MIKFSHIGQLHNLVRSVEARRESGEAIDRVAYRGTVKLHGCNASVVCTPAGLQPQSRNREISVDDDNLGFAGFAGERVAALRELEAELRAAVGLSEDRPLAIFGEWIGPGVQKGAAVTKLSERQWVLFALATVEARPGADELRKRWFELPALGERYAEARVYSIVDGPSWSVELEFGEREALERAADAVESITAEVDERCPWGARFGVEGAGEGLVWEPLGPHFGDSELRFKTKGERHRVLAREGKRKRKAAALDPELLASVAAFVEHAVTDARLEQGFEYLREQGLAVEMPSLGAYLRWLAEDLRRECADELAANELSWKQVARAVNERAKTHFRSRLF